MRQVSTNEKSPPRTIPDGITAFEPETSGFVVWSVAYARVEERLIGSPRALAETIANLPHGGVALDLAGLASPTAERTRAVGRFVDELQHRGVSVVLHGASGGFLTAIQMEKRASRFATCRGLADSVEVLLRYEKIRRRASPGQGRGLSQLRLPAHALSLAPLCVFIRDRLERRGVPQSPLTDLLHESYAAMTATLEEAGEPGGSDISASADVHERVAKVTILDSGRPKPAVEVTPPGCRVDRMHRFRILDRHNALVLEKELSRG